MARYLSRAELSCIAGKYIEMYYALFGISKNDPEPINPEQFANSVLGLNLKMLPLCSDGHILGLTVFRDAVFTATLEGMEQSLLNIYAEGYRNRFCSCGRQMHWMPEFHNSA